MNRVFSWAPALSVLAAASAAGLVACDAPIQPIDTVQNDLSEVTATATGAVEIQSIELRFLGEQDEDITELPSGDYEITLQGIAPATLDQGQIASAENRCAEDLDCGEGSFCDGGVCVTPTETPVSEFQCGTYEVRVTGANGGTCEFAVPRPMGETCMTRTDCPGGLDCVDGACDFREYRGNGLYICFLEGRWDLSTHITSGNCADIFPSAMTGS